MANQKISQLTDGSPVQSGDQFVINRGGSNFRVSGLPSIQVSSVTLTSTQVKSLTTTTGQVAIVAAPGSGKYINVFQVFANLQFATTQYATGTGAIIIGWSNSGSGLQANSTTLLSTTNVKASSSQVVSGALGALSSAGSLAVSAISNQAVSVALGGGSSYTAGDSPLLIKVWYTVESVS